MDEIIDRVVAVIKEEQSNISAILINRGAQNHDEYSYLCGKIEAYDTAISHLESEKEKIYLGSKKKKEVS